MGQDKAFLPIEWQGAVVPLWARQLEVLESLAPEELVISGPRKPGFPESVPLLPDEWANTGPLGGIATCLSRVRSALLLVLAVDLPHIRPEFLRKLLVRCGAGCGVVPVQDNRFEPLVAVYPRTALGLAVEQIRNRDYTLQHFAGKLVDGGLAVGYEVEYREKEQFVNMNTPQDRSSNFRTSD